MKSNLCWLAPLIILLTHTGCQAPHATVDANSSVQPGAVFKLPAPGAVMAQAGPRNASAAVLILDGSEFFPPTAQRVSAQDTSALYDPAWTGGTSPSSGIACGMYWFNVQDYTGPQTLQLDWSIAPDGGNLWLGFGNWERERWDWYPGPASGVPMSPGELTQYAVSGTGDLLVAVVLLGSVTKKAVLDKLRIGTSLAGGWRMFGHDAQHTHQSAAVSCQTGALKWQLALPASSPVGNPVFAADGTVYTCSVDGTLYAIEPDGTLKWSYAGGVASFYSPAVGVDGSVYFANSEDVIAVTAGGELKWTMETGTNYEFNPLLDTADNIYVDGTFDKVMLACISPAGALKWTTHVSYYFAAGGPVQALDKTLYNCGVPGYICIISATGEALGMIDATYNAGNTPAVYHDLLICAGRATSEIGQLEAYRAGALLWACPVGALIDSSPAVSTDGVSYLNCTDGLLYAISESGSLLWSVSAGGRSNPAIGADGVIYASGTDNRLHAFNPDGSQLWQSEPAGGELYDPAIADDGTLVVGCYDGLVRAYAD